MFSVSTKSNQNQISSNSCCHINCNVSSVCNLSNIDNFDNNIFKPFINCKDLRLEHRLGGGNFGEVWKASNSQNHYFAVKILHTPTIQSIQNFKNEINMLSLLDHPKIIKFYGCKIQEKNQCFWIVTNLMEKGNLKEYLRLEETQNSLHFADLMYIIVQITTGMLYLHVIFCKYLIFFRIKKLYIEI